MHKHKKNFIILINIMLVIAFCLVIYKIFKTFAGNPVILKKELMKFGNLGKVILILIMAFQVIFVFLPGEVIEVAAGFSYGTFEGLITCLLGTIIGTIIIYGLLNKYGIKFINKFYDTNKINQINFLKKEKHLEIIIFIIFFIPGTPKDLITYLAPFTRLELTTFLAITSIARIPSIITSTISGSALSNQNYQLTIWVFIITGAISILGLLIYKIYVYKKNL
ncbi:MAG: TVP38/TMEM64 family protein [[Clostridium] spiroforme]|uniref:TVP38/TMEM64 family membrane protein n=1 Tax=Thomasclavelia spiroformis TaxID=29348 RepID=A0A943EJZ3_9FIRM|nr:VTT domain-containing protein [Thomasclavelia spiroformis]MBS5587959.1 TVP38/TMEM64 family protein [Thomasclavelia spiroformis]